MKNYWSLSKFADNLRKIFGLPKMLSSGTCEEWDAFHKEELAKSKIGVKVIDSLDTIQNIIYYIPTKITDCVYWISNVKSSSHVLRTSTKLGSWSDLPQKIPDGLMYGIIDFVEKECFWMEVMNSDHPYGKQSYIRRKLFPKQISEVDRMYFGLAYLDFQIENSDSETKVAYQEIIDAYSFAKFKYFIFDAYDLSGYSERYKDDATTFCKQDIEECREYYKKIDDLEKDFYSETTKSCYNLVKHRNLLWT